MCFGTATYSLINIVKWNKDNNKSKQIISDIQTNNFNDSDIDFNKLLKQNNETVGWIKINGTNINYPFVQSKDNSYYLNHSFNKEKNDAGWIFLDYRNDVNNLDKNNILYGHSRKDKTMFGSLFNVLNKNWLNNLDNHIIKLTTKDYNSLWQIFSIYIIKNENYYITTNFNTQKDYIMYINTIINRSIYNFNIQVTQNDTLLTLSTCDGNSKKLVVHAKLIKKEVKTQE